MRARTLLASPAFLWVASCSTPEFGPQYLDLPDASDACLMQLEVPKTIQGDWAWDLYSCVNAKSGYFNELNGLVFYATHNPDATSLLFPVTEDPTPSERVASSFDMVSLLDSVTDLLNDPADPVDMVAQIHGALHDDYPSLMIGGIGMLEAITHQIATCEASWLADDPETKQCHTLRLARQLLDRDDVLKAVDHVLTAFSGALPEPETEEAATWQESIRSIAELMDKASSGPNNPLLDLARSTIGQDDDQARLLEALQLLRRVLFLQKDDGSYSDAMIAGEDGFADHFARLWRDGSLQAVPDELDWLLTHDVDGREVPLGSDETVVAELLTVLSDLTLGSTDDTSLLDIGIDVVNNLYLNDGDLNALVASLSDAVEIVCDDSVRPLSESLQEVCGLADAAFPPLDTMTANSPNLIRTGLATIYVYSRFHRVPDADDPTVDHVDLEVLFGALDLLDAWVEITPALDLLASDEPSTDPPGQTLAPFLDLIPVFINPRLGRLTPAGADAIFLVDFATGTWVIDERSGTSLANPIMLVAPPLRRLLFSEELGHAPLELDALMEVAAEVLLSDGPVGIDGLSTFLDVVLSAFPEPEADAPAEPLPEDPYGSLKELLDNDELWRPLVNIAGDKSFADLISPHPYPHQAAWRADAQYWLRERLQSGLFSRITHWAAGLLDSLGFGHEDETP